MSAALSHIPFEEFRYVGTDIDRATGSVVLRYALDDLPFEEAYTFDLPEDGDWPGAADEAVRLLFLLAGVSYYKAGAPLNIDLGETPIRPGEVEFLIDYYIDGLGEFANDNGLDLSDLTITGGTVAMPAPPAHADPDVALIPFGGGIDSIVTVEALRPVVPTLRLFVLSGASGRYAALEDAAAVADLPILRAERQLDEKILRSRELGYLNGHVPVTAVVSAAAVVTAVLHGAGHVVMSNERSASVGSTIDGQQVNHQHSKSEAYETAFATVLDAAMPDGPRWFSYLRQFSELAIARRFAEQDRYHGTFRSCNRAFHVDPAVRWDRWCGECDKCCFIDLILSPFLSADALTEIFNGTEPLAETRLIPQFEALVGLDANVKPFECVGDVEECRAATHMAADRSDADRRPVLAVLLDNLPDSAPDIPPFLHAQGKFHGPDALSPSPDLG